MAAPAIKKLSIITTPFTALLLVLLVVGGITFLDLKNNRRNRWLDFTLFFITGAAGLLLIFLWFLTNHSQTVANFNILWVFPLNIIVAFLLVKKKTAPKWIGKYLWVLFVGILLVIPVWLFKVQIFSPLIILSLLTLGIRYLFLQHYFKHNL